MQNIDAYDRDSGYICSDHYFYDHLLCDYHRKIIASGRENTERKKLMTKQKKTMQDVGKKQNFEEKKENRRKKKTTGNSEKRRKKRTDKHAVGVSFATTLTGKSPDMKEIAPEPAEEPVPEPEESPSFVINRAEPAPDVEEAEPFAEEPYEPVRESKKEVGSYGGCRDGACGGCSCCG